MATAELEISADLIRDLLREQHPDLADLPFLVGGPFQKRRRSRRKQYPARARARAR